MDSNNRMLDQRRPKHLTIGPSQQNIVPNVKYTSKCKDRYIYPYFNFSFLTVDANTYLPGFDTVTTYYLKDLPYSPDFCYRIFDLFQ